MYNEIGRQMIFPRLSLPVVAPSLLLLLAQSVSATPSASAPAFLPDRTLECVLSRATNVDPSKQQTTADLVFEGRHRLALRLPAVPARRGAPPDPSDPAEPVDKRTRILADPDGLMKTVAPDFDRVVDLWPQRVEMIAKTSETSANGIPLMRLFVISPVDAKGTSASIFMTTAADAASMDINAMYHGACKVSLTRTHGGV